MRWCCGGRTDLQQPPTIAASPQLQQRQPTSSERPIATGVDVARSVSFSPSPTGPSVAARRRAPKRGDANGSGDDEAPLMDETPLLIMTAASPLNHADGTKAIARWGPMLLKAHKLALYVNSNPSTSSSCPFIERLKQTEWSVIQCTGPNARNELQRSKAAVVLLDHKLNDLNGITSSLKSVIEGEDVLYSVLIDRVPTEKRLRAFWKADIHQFFLYSSTETSFCELFGRLISRLRAIPALFAVVEEAEQPIKICDERNIVQYVNRAYEIVTGRSRAEVLGTDASEMRLKALNGAPPTQQTEPITPTPLGTVTTPTTSTTAGLPPLASASSPSAQVPGSAGATTPQSTCSGAAPATSAVSTAHYTDENLLPTHGGSFGSATANAFAQLANRRRSSEWHCITVPSSSQSAQFVYVKRGSADAAICRDLSLKSLRSNSALVDAPITEALNVLSNILHKCDDDTQTHIRDAIKMLSASELYAPSITRFRDNDRIASGYYDGLIRLHHPARQRKRSVVDAFRENQRRVSGSETRRRISTDVVNALESEHAWQFDVIELERVTDHHPLAHLGAKIFERWNVGETLRCGSDTISRWLTVIEANYQSSNTYHNATHAADVLQATSYFLNAENVAQYVQDTHAIAALIAATVHDLDHPGRGNAFLMNTRQRLALLYNDHSVLENHHVALAFQLTLAQPGVNIFARMPRSEFAAMRQAIIDMVLATDMSKHFEYLTKFQQLMLMSDTDENREANSLTVCRMMIKCADINNPTREWKLCHEWAMRIVEEYFEQTSEETEKGLPVTMKGFDRETCNIPVTQCTFVDLFAREAFTVWCEFSDLPLLLVQLESNYERWKQMGDTWDVSKKSKSTFDTLISVYLYLWLRICSYPQTQSFRFIFYFAT
ncbi:hypothetical protein M3Y94_01319500 [Aphelenchoides besseyi]|nr:hypothetical protein M3Y94_01319500 [Aphelenchoides besseyi]